MGLDFNWKFEDYIYLTKFHSENVEMYSPLILRNEKKLEYPKFLYKFYGKSNNNLHSLLKGYLYFSNPKFFNDPFDSLVNRERYIRKGGDRITKHRENMGICSFSLINNNPLMWGHYTNNYKGFCLKFKNDSLLKNNYIQIRNHVSYLKNYQFSNDNLNKEISDLYKLSIKKEDKEHIQKVLTTSFEYCWKYYDWKYEQEFRGISWVTDKFKRQLKYNKKDVKEIYIGYKMKDIDLVYYDLLIEILKNNYPKIKVYEVKPNPLDVKLDFIEIEIND